MVWPALDSGRLLEVCGDADPRGMTARDRTRLIGELVLPASPLHASRLAVLTPGRPAF